MIYYLLTHFHNLLLIKLVSDTLNCCDCLSSITLLYSNMYESFLTATHAFFVMERVAKRICVMFIK